MKLDLELEQLMPLGLGISLFVNNFFYFLIANNSYLYRNFLSV